MKKVFLFSVLFLGIQMISAQENFEISTLRIGPFSLKMDVSEADKIAGKKLKATDYDSPQQINYKGEIFKIYIYGSYSDSSKDERNIGSISTTSKKFRTKSGMGVGSTKDELLNTYRNYPNFEFYTPKDDNDKYITSEGYFQLRDNEAYTMLSFKLVNNIVTEVSVFYNEGC